MNGAPLQCDAAAGSATFRPERMGPNISFAFGRHSVGRNKMMHVLVPAEHVSLVSTTKARHRLQQRVENSFQVCRRAADGLQNVPCRSQLVDRASQIARALAQLVQQPRILHGDDSLGGEALKQSNLIVAERLYLPAVDRNRTDQRIILAQSNIKNGARTAQLDDGSPAGIPLPVGLAV